MSNCRRRDCPIAGAHSHCASCGTNLYGESELCSFHGGGDWEWAFANRIFCDLIHRRVDPPPNDLVIPDTDAVMAPEPIAFA